VADYPFAPPHVNKAALPPGPWSEEEDRKTWKDPASGYCCAVVRQPGMGALCGYVRIPVGHPFHGKEIGDQVAVPPGALERMTEIGLDVGVVDAFLEAFGEEPVEGTKRLSVVLHVHGGLSFADADPDGGGGLDSTRCTA
jgi:hypothetical protein